MRTEPSTPMASALARLRTPMGRARRWLAARGLPTRVALLMAGLGALGAAGYLASLADSAPRSWAWVHEGRKLSADDVTAIAEALDAAEIAHVVDSSGRIGVRPDRKAEALAALAKSKVVPPTLDELAREPEAASILDDPDTRARRDNHLLEQKLKRRIEGLDDAIASAQVEVLRVKVRGGYNASTKVSANIYLKTEGGRRLGSRVVEGIETFLRGAIPDLRAEDITVADRTGYRYLAAGNPGLKEQNQTRAQGEMWRDSIAEGLQHIPNVGVSVLVDTVAVPPPPPPEPAPPASAESVRPNARVAVEPEPAPSPPAPAAPMTRTRASVWVRIPRTFYYMAFLAQSGRHPTTEDLKPMQATTEKTVRDAVRITIPGHILGEVTIDLVQDDLANARALLISSAPESPRPWPWLALSGALGLSAGLAALAALIRLATRRPAARPSRSALRQGYVADGPAGPVPGPSERVRELIRLNPEAAAGVLQRWIGQGGALE